MACSDDNFVNISSGNSTIQLDVQFSEFPAGFGKIGETAEVTRVQVRVSGPGMDPIQAALSISGNTASGTIEVPKGSARVFVVEGFDPNDILLFSGETTQDINNDTENVGIVASWLTTSVTITAMMPQPYNEFSDATNFAGVEFIGDGLRDPLWKELNIQSGTANATGTFVVPRGAKEVYVLASLFAGPLEFELFDGFRQINVGVTVPPLQITLDPIDDQAIAFFDHDGSFEVYRFSTTAGDIVATEFNVNDYTASPVFVKEIYYEDMLWEGISGDFEIIIMDGAGNIKFVSLPLPMQDDGPSLWTLLYNDPGASGIFNDFVKAGFRYASNSGRPWIGFDTDNPLGTSWYFESASGSWFTQNDGNFAITLVVQSSTGAEIVLSSDKNSRTKLNEIRNSKLRVGKAYQAAYSN